MTCTIVGWLPIFSRPNAVEIVLDSWKFLQKQRSFQLFGYVIMENHLHLVASAPDLVKVMKDFKSFTARKIVDALEANREMMLLELLAVLKVASRMQSDYQVWQAGYHPKEIANDEMMRQKLEYMHNNPIKRGYVDEHVHWRYSSARNYAGMPGFIDVVTTW
jgi:REP element-mobilizing transposase RayT